METANAPMVQEPNRSGLFSFGEWVIDLIPALKESVRIREEPEGVAFVNTKIGGYILVSPFEAFLLSLFDGTRTVENIVSIFKSLKNSPEDEKIQSDVYRFIQYRSEYVELIENPLKKGRVQIDPYIFLLKPNVFHKPERCCAPLAVDLYLTRRCNLNCVYCFADAKYQSNQTINDRYDEMSLDRINSLIDQIAEFEIKRITLTGGEPTLRPDLAEIIHRLMNNGIEVFLATNAYSMSDRLAQELKDSGLREVQVKLDAAHPEVQDRLSGVKGSYEKLIKGIETLKKHSFKVSVAAVVTSWNIKEIPEVIKICTDMEIDKVEPRIYTPGIWALHGRGGAYLNPSSNSILWLGQKIRELQEKYKDIIEIPLLDTSKFSVVKENEVPACPGLKSAIGILENGLVVPCELLADFSDDFIIGDANKQTLIDIWNSDKAERWALRKYPQVGEPCPSCDEFKRCKGGCPWKSLVAYGIWSADPYCVKAPNPTRVPFAAVSADKS